MTCGDHFWHGSIVPEDEFWNNAGCPPASSGKTSASYAILNFHQIHCSCIFFHWSRIVRCWLINICCSFVSFCCKLVIIMCWLFNISTNFSCPFVDSSCGTSASSDGIPFSPATVRATMMLHITARHFSFQAVCWV